MNHKKTQISHLKIISMKCPECPTFIFIGVTVLKKSVTPGFSSGYGQVVGLFLKNMVVVLLSQKKSQSVFYKEMYFLFYIFFLILLMNKKM
jgi:hypothetical protein